MKTPLLIRSSRELNHVGCCIGYAHYPPAYAEAKQPIEIVVPVDKRPWYEKANTIDEIHKVQAVEQVRRYVANPVFFKCGENRPDFVVLQITVPPTKYNEALEDLNHFFREALDAQL
ncbi:hypothetical protein [Caudoviricetes sp.]|nr:hypothetical protein [Caudoviricetes sp.]